MRKFKKNLDWINRTDRILKGKEGEVIIESRGYVKHGRERIKFLMASVYMDPYTETHEWIYIVAPDDERKFRYMSGEQWCHKWFARIPAGVWCRIVERQEEGINRKGDEGYG